MTEEVTGTSKPPSEHSLVKPPSKDSTDKSLQSDTSETTTKHDEAIEGEEEERLDDPEQEPFSYIQMLDAPRELPEAVDITETHLKQISEKLGLIKLCWPDLSNVSFEHQANFQHSYWNNSKKEKLLLLYAENLRRQFCYRYPNRKPLILACDNECGIQKMVCSTICPTTLPYPELYPWEGCAKFVADHLIFEPLEEPILIPRRLYSPHTTFLRQSGHSFEIATALCSILIGVGFDAYLVSGYATKDVTQKIMSRVDCPFEIIQDKDPEPEVEEEDPKYKITPTKQLESKFLVAMKQRELDKLKEEQAREAEVERQKLLEDERRPFDALEGQRIHAWVLLAAGSRDIKETVFIEPSTGMSHSLNSDLYCGIESVWNNENYWVNLQDCSQSQDLGCLSYDLTDIDKWEHLLVAEPLRWRKQKLDEIGEEEEPEDVCDEKHLDMPASWSMSISIPHNVLTRRFPDGSKVTQYKRTLVEEYAPYVCDDGLVRKITRYIDFDCTNIKSVEEIYENRNDKLIRIFLDAETNLETDYFAPGRKDSVIRHIFYKDRDNVETERTIFLDSKARSDGLSKVEIVPYISTEYYCDRDDKLYYRQVQYPEKTTSRDEEEGVPNRRPILKIIQKFSRNEEKSANDDINVREFNIRDGEIHLKYHYGKDNVTASTRSFIKSPMSEMGSGMNFRTELTYGYQAQIGAKPSRQQLQTYLLAEQQLKEEKEVIISIRDFENQLSEFLFLRAHEMAFPKLDVSVYDREQNQEYRVSMLEQEEKQRMCKEKEVEQEIDYLSPYLARLGYPSSLSYQEALDIKYACLEEFKQLLVNRANDIQHQFQKMSTKIDDMQTWYTQNHENLSPNEEATYFQEVNDSLFYLRTLEIRLSRHKDLSFLRYEAMVQYVNCHPMLDVLGD